jgi:Zn-dependent M28 family amino/carboxypeptidase
LSSKIRFGTAVFFAIVFASFAHPSFAQSNAAKGSAGESWWNHVKVLADDKMEGRGTASPGLERAAEYIVGELKKAGAKPAGTKGFYQPIKFRTRELDESKSSLEIISGDQTIKAEIPVDAVFSTRYDLTPAIDAPLVFAGYGLRIPEAQYDDFAGLDLKGKVVVVFSGAPANIPGSLTAHYQSTAEKSRLMRELGIRGFITIPNPAVMEVPWDRIASSRTIPSFAIDDPKLNDSTGIELAVIWNPEKAESLFGGTGHTFAEIAALGKDRKTLPKFDMKKSVKARTQLIQRKLESSNVVAKIEGSDPKLKNEYVALSAHMDHLGIGPAINGDKIYNGAMDNASGVASLIEVARSLTGTKFKRSLLFLFVTGEEKGLLGSGYFATHPTVPIDSIVADINTDMFLPIFPMKMLIAYGLEESSLGDTLTDVARREGLKTMGDPEPLLNHFIRSDQYNFIKQGIPALALKNGYEKGSPEETKVHEWAKARYHAPSDDLQQPVDLSAAEEFDKVVRALLVEVANADSRPQWKQDSFFRRFAAERSHAGLH